MGVRRRFYLIHILAIQIINAGLAQCLSLPLTGVSGTASPNQLPCSSTSSSSSSSATVASPPHTTVNFGPSGSSSSLQPRLPSSPVSKPAQNLKISNVQISLPNGDPVPPSSNLVISSYGTPTITSMTPKIDIPSSIGSLTSVNILPSCLNSVGGLPTGVSNVQSGLPNLLPSQVQGSSNLNSFKPNLPPSVPTLNRLPSLGPSNSQNSLSSVASSALNSCNSPQNLASPNVTPNVVSFGSNINQGSNSQLNLPYVNVLPSSQISNSFSQNSQLSTCLSQSSQLSNSLSQYSQSPPNSLDSVSTCPTSSAQGGKNGILQVVSSPLPSSTFSNVGLSQNSVLNSNLLSKEPALNLLPANSGVSLNNVNFIARNVASSVSSQSPCSSNFVPSDNSQSTQIRPSSVNIQEIANAVFNQAQLNNQLNSVAPTSPQNILTFNQLSESVPVNLNYQQLSNCEQTANLPNFLISNSFLPPNVVVPNTVVNTLNSPLTATGPNPATASENLNALVSEFVKKFLSTFDPNDFVQSVPPSVSNSALSDISPPQVVVSTTSVSVPESAPQVVTTVNSISVQETPSDLINTVEVSSTDGYNFPVVLPTSFASSPVSELPSLPPGYPAPLPPIIFGDSGKSSKGIKEFVKVLLLQQVLDGSNGCGCNGGPDLDSLLALILAYM